jgi:hypothetical protein
MRDVIKKILKEDMDWATNQPDLPLDSIMELANQYEKIKSLKLEMEKYMEGKTGLESLTDDERDYRGNIQGYRSHVDMYRDKYILEQVREIYNEVNNIEGSLRDLPSSLDHLQYLVTGIDTEEQDED